MNIRAVRYFFGSIVLIAHLGAIFVYAFYGNTYLPTIKDVIQGVLTVLPVAATYAVVFVKYVSSNPTRLQSEIGVEMDLAPFMVQLVILLLFSVALIGVPIYIFLDGAQDYQNTKLVTGGIDTIFGGYLASIFGKLFPKEVYE